MTGLIAAARVSGGTERLAAFVSAGLLRRLDTVTREALLALCLVLEKGEAAGDPELLTGLGLIVATESGPVELSRRFLQDIITSGDEFASPTHFSSSVHNALAGQVSLLKKITGPVRTLSAGPETLFAAVAAAESWLANGAARRVLLACCDEPSSLYPLMEPEITDRPAGAVAWLLGPVTGKVTCCMELKRQDKALAEGIIPTAFSLFLSVHERIQKGIPAEGWTLDGCDGSAGLQLALFPAG